MLMDLSEQFRPSNEVIFEFDVDSNQEKWFNVVDEVQEQSDSWIQ